MRAVCAQSPAALIEAHLLTLLLVAPELARALDVPAEIAAALTFSREGNARGWTLRIAHGVADFVLEAVKRPASLLFFDVEHADPTDREFIAVLRRRADPAMLAIEVRSGPEAPPIDDGPRAFLAAYGEAPVPADDAALLLAVSNLCMRLAYYDAALEWAGRGDALVDPGTEPERHGKLTRNVLFALLLLGRYEETEAVCQKSAPSADPALATHIAYIKAILNARFYAVARRDYDAARSFVEQSLAFTDRLPVSETRAVNHAFLMNTMALVEMRKGRHTEALDLLDAALAYMEREAPSRYGVERIILLQNRARLHVAGRRIDAAIADLTTLLGSEPSNSEAYVDRGLLRQRAGEYEAALHDYDLAIRWSPPYWEPHFNRAQVLAASGRREAAIAEYDRVAVLHPDHLETLIDRGRLHLELGELDRAGRDAAAALRLDAGNARALCLRGLVALRRRALDEADRDLSAAVAADPLLADAWANRATVHFKRGALDAARADIDRAAALREDVDILHNRGRILEALELWDAAAASYRRLLEISPGDAALVADRLELCVRRRPVAEGA